MRRLLHLTILVALIALATQSALADSLYVKITNGIVAGQSAMVRVPSIKLTALASQDGPSAISSASRPLEPTASVHSFAVTATPEPSSLLLFGTGLLSASFCLWWRRRVNA
ncbi:MAG: PEP-CTERM sorting domain-containing protein [Terriglobia bacterium]